MALRTNVGSGDYGVGDDTARATTEAVNAAQAIYKKMKNQYGSSSIFETPYVLEEDASVATLFKMEVTRDVAVAPK